MECLTLWLIIEVICRCLKFKHITLYNNNSLSVHWVYWMAAKISSIVMEILRALEFQIYAQQASPLTPLHIPGVANTLSDIASLSFGSNFWECATDTDLQHLFNAFFPLPTQQSWSILCLSSAIAKKLTSVL